MVLPDLVRENHLVIEQLEVISLKKACINKLQEFILSGKFAIGERLPSERDLAVMLGVSRPVLHESIVALNAQGLVHIEARKGVFVCDYQRESSMALLNTLLEYEEGDFNPELFRSLIEGRLLIERETAHLAAIHCDQKQAQHLQQILETGRDAAKQSAQTLCDHDFQFHLEIALASGNQMYPMILNSLKGVHKNLAGKFYQQVYGKEDAQKVLDFHEKLVNAITAKNAKKASEIMETLLRHGEEATIRILYVK